MPEKATKKAADKTDQGSEGCARSNRAVAGFCGLTALLAALKSRPAMDSPHGAIQAGIFGHFWGGRQAACGACAGAGST